MTACSACGRSLAIDIGDENTSNAAASTAAASNAAVSSCETVPDDIQLQCGCHFHWECLLDNHQGFSCPMCERSILSLSPRGNPCVISTLNNEGGRQTALDILPFLNENGYLRAHPGERRGRAFLEFVRERDREAILDMATEDDGEAKQGDDPLQKAPQLNIDQMLRYQDPMDGMRSALHIAITQRNLGVVWLLLHRASKLPVEQVPPIMVQIAASIKSRRRDQTGLVDIRTLRDSNGLTAAQYARASGWDLFDIGLLEADGG